MLIVGCSYSFAAQTPLNAEETELVMRACGCVRCLNALSKGPAEKMETKKSMSQHAFVFVRLESVDGYSILPIIMLPKVGDFKVYYFRGRTEEEALRQANLPASIICGVFKGRIKAVIQQVPELERSPAVPVKLYLVAATSLDRQEGYLEELERFGATEVRFLWADSPLDALNMFLPALSLELRVGTLDEVKCEILEMHQVTIHAEEVPIV